VVIFWGTQSGKSERLAKALARECQKRYGISALAADLDNYDHEHLASMPENKYVGFIVSTFGEGDPSDNAVGLQEYFSRAQKDQLSNLRYFAFGLGNSKYQHFNQFVIEVDKTLTKAGAHRLGFVGKADEALRSDNAWAEWKEDLLSKLGLSLNKSELDLKEDLYQADFELVDRPSGVTGTGEFPSRGAPRQTSVAVIKEARPLALPGQTSAAHIPREYLHIELDVGQNSLHYQTGDHVAVWPINNENEVQRFSVLFGWDNETFRAVVNIRARDDDELKPPVQTPTSREAILRYYLDIGGPVSRATIQLLAHFAPTIAAKEFLNSALIKDDTDADYMTVSRLMRLSGPDSVWPATLFELLIQHLPLLQPRYYSIASSPIVDPGRIAITVAVVVAEISGQAKRKPFYGLASNYLYSLSRPRLKIETSTSEDTRPKFVLDRTESKALIHVRPSSFKLPADPTCPIIMMAAGSGIAPFRAFVQERVHQILISNQTVGRMVLFLGSRSPDEDLLYSEEWRDIQGRLCRAGKKDIFKIYFAFSRSSIDRKMYVQDLIIDRQDELLDMIVDKGAGCYICGSIKLATGIKRSMKQMLSSGRGWQGEKCDEYIDALKREGRLKEDVWA
jgi:NADPH-ferrihemoprotein reductase